MNQIEEIRQKASIVKREKRCVEQQAFINLNADIFYEGMIESIIENLNQQPVLHSNNAKQRDIQNEFVRIQLIREMDSIKARN